MVKTRSSRIMLLGDFFTKEGKASSNINPGHFVEFGGTNDLQKQSSANEVVRPAIALDNTLEGKTLNDEYVEGDHVVYGVAYTGCEVQVKLPANAAAVVKGDKLAMNGDGCVKKWTTGHVVGFALESIDNSAGSTEVFINMEIL